MISAFSSKVVGALLLLAVALFVLPFRATGQAHKLAGGYEYWLAIPPNEEANFGSEIELTMVICALEKQANIHVEIPWIGASFEQVIPAGSATRISSIDGKLPWDLEVRETGTAQTKGIHVQSDEPVTVRLYSARSFSADAFTAIPVHMWGRSYRHIAYYEQADPIKRRGSGFVIVAAHDNTEVRINLEARGVGQTTDGHSPGMQYDVVLQRGQTYMVHGDGLSEGFDLSGTQITASNPIGLISFHMRSIVPLAMGAGDRDFLVEMLPPLEYWGRRFVSRELLRVGFGDYFRVVAAKDNTTVKLRTYDSTGKESSSREFTITDAGDFAEFGEHAPEASPRADAIRGVSLWEADKPIQVMMYSYSSDWDGAPGYNPFMVALTPFELASTVEVVDIPSGTGLSVIDIITEDNPNLLEDLRLNGQPIAQIDPDFMRIPYGDEGLRCSRIHLGPGTKRISGDALFVGMLHTYGGNSIHGIPLGRTAFPLRAAEAPDLPTFVTTAADCFSAEIEVSGGGPVPLALMRTNSRTLSNVAINPPDALVIDPVVGVMKRSFRVEVIDKSLDAFAEFEVFDQAGTRAKHQFIYAAAQLDVTPTEVLRENLQTGDELLISLALSNNASDVQRIDYLYLLHGNRGMRIIDKPALPLSLGASQNLPIKVEALAGEVGIVYDTLVVGDTCRELVRVPLELQVERGIEGKPVVLAFDHDFRDVFIDDSVCEEVEVKNIGSELLTVYCITDVDDDSYIFAQSGCETFFPQVLNPQESMQLDICFRPRTTGTHTTQLTVQSDAEGVDSIIFLQGRGIETATDVVDTDSDLTEPFVLRAYPNPTDDLLFVSGPEVAGSSAYSCVDRLGRSTAVSQLASGADGTAVFDVAALPPGMYNLVLTHAGGRSFVTFFIVR